MIPTCFPNINVVLNCGKLLKLHMHSLWAIWCLKQGDTSGKGAWGSPKNFPNISKKFNFFNFSIVNPPYLLCFLRNKFLKSSLVLSKRWYHRIIHQIIWRLYPGTMWYGILSLWGKWHFGHFVILGIMSFGHFVTLGILSHLGKMSFGHYVFGHFVILGHFVTLGIMLYNPFI